MTAQLRLRIDQLEKIRRWTGLTKDADLAARMKTDPGNLSRVLNGKQSPGPRFIAALCKALDADLGDLFEVADEEVA